MVSVDGTTFTVKPSREGRLLDRRALETRLAGDPSAIPGAIDLPLTTTQPAVTTDEAKQQVAQAGEVLRRGTVLDELYDAAGVEDAELLDRLAK